MVSMPQPSSSIQLKSVQEGAAWSAHALVTLDARTLSSYRLWATLVT